ncbi:hypothetical protein [Mycobacterium sp. NPDC050853]
MEPYPRPHRPNTPASGYNVGRGPIQLTGEGNYEAAGMRWVST